MPIKVSQKKSLAELRPEIASEWDYERNAPLTPQDVTVGSTRKVWWLCDKGHHWETRLFSRTGKNGPGCPYCAGYLPIPGETDLGTLRPEVTSEWDYERNAPLTPRDVTVGSGRKVWWTCSKGHHWEATVNSRTKKHGTGCPYCSRIRSFSKPHRLIEGVTDLGTVRPDIASEWDYERNASLTPQDVTFSSKKKVWWVCDKGHHWEARINSRTNRNGTGCPYCAGYLPIPGETDLGTLRLDIAAQWDYERNAPLTPQAVTVGSNKKVWWTCDKNHHWEARIDHRTQKNGTGCPYCRKIRHS